MPSRDQSIEEARAALRALGEELERLADADPADPVLDVVALVSERFHLVRRADLLAWARRSEIGPHREKSIAAHLDDSPAEPFADCPEMTTAAARGVRTRGRRAAEAARDGSDARDGRQDRGAKAVRG